MRRVYVEIHWTLLLKFSHKKQELHWQGLCSEPLDIAIKVFPINNRSFIGRVYVVNHWTLLLKFFPLKTEVSLAGFM